MSKPEDREWLELKLYNAEKTNKALEDEVEQLRKLLRKCQPYIAGWTEARELFVEIEKEVGDE